MSFLLGRDLRECNLVKWPLYCLSYIVKYYILQSDNKGRYIWLLKAGTVELILTVDKNESCKL